MKRQEQVRVSFIGPAVGVVLAALLGWLLHGFTLGSGLLNLSYDLLAVAPRSVPPMRDVAVIHMDERSHEELRQSPNAPWDRALHARLIERLTAAGARAIVFDIVFSDPGRPEADAPLAEAIRRSGRVILAVDRFRPGVYRGQFAGSDQVGAEVTGLDKYTPPYELFRTNAADLGSADVEPGRDLVVRRIPPNDGVLPTLSWATAAFLQAPVTQSPGAEAVPRWIHYPPRPDLGISKSYYEALDPRLVPDDYFRGKVVFIGARLITKFAGDRKDEYRTPHSFWISGEQHRDSLFMAGVDIQALATANLLHGDWVRRLSTPVELLLIVLLGAGIGLLLIRFRPFLAVGIALLLVVGVAAVAYGVFVGRLIWFPWLVLVVQIAAALLWSIIFNSVRLYVENRLYVQSLELYLSPKLVKKFAHDKRLLTPGAQKQTLTILFTDIAGFTSISEGMDSDELAQLMNQYFQTAVAQCIHPTDGTVVKYIGDAIFAFWNAPDPQPDHARRACESALRFRDQPLTVVRGQPLITRLGLHTGEANVGNFGSTRRVDYTAIGENINLASRMEGLNKYLGTQILLTGDTQRCVADQFITRPLGRFRLKGFEKSVEVFELAGWREQAGALQPLRERFAAALERFQRRDFAEAEARFQQVLQLQPDDGPAKFYLKHLAELRDHPPGPDWQGEVELKEK